MLLRFNYENERIKNKIKKINKRKTKIINYINNLKSSSNKLKEQLLLNNLSTEKTLNNQYNYVKDTFLIPNSRFIIKNKKLHIHHIPRKILTQNITTIQEEITFYPNYNISNFIKSSTKRSFKFFLSDKLYYISLLHPANSTYFHFIFETLTYVFMIYKKYNFFNASQSDIPIFIIEKNNFNYILKKIFKNIPLIEIKRSKTYSLFCKNLIIPDIENYNYYFTWNKKHVNSNSDIYYVNKDILTEFKDYVKNMFVDKNEYDAKYTVLIKRKKERCFNVEEHEKYIIEKFPNLKIIFFEDLDFIEQVKIMSNCNLLILQPGSGFINTLFMPENSNIITLASNNNINNFNLFEEISSVSNKKINWIKAPILQENPLFRKKIEKDNSIYNILKNYALSNDRKSFFLNYHPYNYKADFKSISIDNLTNIIENIIK